MLGALWVVITAVLARRQVQAVEDRLAQVKTLVAEGRVAEAQQVARTLPAMTDRAHRLTSGPAWWTAAAVPYLGDPLDVARGTTAAVQKLGDTAIPDLLRVAGDINPQTLRVSGHTVALAPLVRAVPTLQQAGSSLHSAIDTVAGLPSNTWLGAVDRGRSSLLSQLDAVSGYVDAASRAARVLPGMLGDDGATRRYFIGLQNEAELRGTGGIPGAFTIATAKNGTITFQRFESDSALLPGTKNNAIDTGLDFGSSYNQLYGAGLPTQEFNDSNVSPQFPYAAQIWAAMWEKQYHQHIDGALALDPTALGYFLAATGPTTASGHEVTAQNVVALTERDVYALYPDNAQRRQFLVSVLKAAATKLTSGAGSPVAIVQAASRAAAERRLLVWSSDAATQKLLEQTTYAGDISADGAPLSALVLNNSAAGKLDYYLQRSVNYSRTGCGPRRDVDVTITLRNTAPASGLPPYVTTRLDKFPPKNAKPGDSRVTLDYYATGGALVQSATLNDKRVGVNASTTLGRTVIRLDVELPRGQTQTIHLHLDEPAMIGAPQIWLQPAVTPMSLTYANQTCG